MDTYIWLTLTLMHFDTDIADKDRKREIEKRLFRQKNLNFGFESNSFAR